MLIRLIVFSIYSSGDTGKGNVQSKMDLTTHQDVDALFDKLRVMVLTNPETYFQVPS